MFSLFLCADFSALPSLFPAFILIQHQVAALIMNGGILRIMRKVNRFYTVAFVEPHAADADCGFFLFRDFIHTKAEEITVFRLQNNVFCSFIMMTLYHFVTLLQL